MNTDSLTKTPFIDLNLFTNKIMLNGNSWYCLFYDAVNILIPLGAVFNSQVDFSYCSKDIVSVRGLIRDFPEVISVNWGWLSAALCVRIVNSRTIRCRFLGCEIRNEYRILEGKRLENIVILKREREREGDKIILRWMLRK